MPSHDWERCRFWFDVGLASGSSFYRNGASIIFLGLAISSKKKFFRCGVGFSVPMHFSRFFFRFRVSTELGRDVRLTDASFLWPRSKTLPDELCLLASALASYRTPLHTRTLSPTHTWWVLLSLTLSHTLKRYNTYTYLVLLTHM